MFGGNREAVFSCAANFKRVLVATVIFVACSLWFYVGGRAQVESPRAAAAGYVGNQACAKCHTAIYETYSHHPMALDSGPVATAQPSDQTPVAGSFRHKESSLSYRIYRKGDQTIFSYERSSDGGGLRGQQPLDYFVGSNKVGRSYLYSIDGYLFQAPISYYAQKKRWDISPGYEAARELPIRPIEVSCLNCHATGAQHVSGTLNRYASPAFLQNGVGCERCHGPGSEHIMGRGEMVNPIKLSAERRDSLCAQCHLLSTVRITKPGKDMSLFRPGDSLADYASYFVDDDHGSRSTVAIGHVEGLAQSTCKRRSGERMSCMSCHDPHTEATAQERVVYYREKCLSCHQTQATVWQKQHFAESLDCISCHMPKVSAQDIAHTASTDHRILRRPSIARSDVAAAREQTLVEFTNTNGQTSARDLGLAYAELALRTNAARHRDEAFRLLSAAIADYPKDTEVLTRLAYLYQERGNTERARTLYEASLREDKHQPSALVNLGAIYAEGHQTESAIAMWRGALEYDPSSSAAGVNLAVTLCSKGDRKQAREVLRQVIKFNPDLGAAKALLADLNNARSQCRINSN